MPKPKPKKRDVSKKSNKEHKLSSVRLSKSELEEILTFSKGLARASGKLALSYYGHADPTLKFDHHLVTEADLVIKEYIRKEVRENFPNHFFGGEDFSLRKNFGETREPIWVVDPVDGSAAFSSAQPVWGVSLALFDGKRSVLGVFFMPVTGELYSAIRNGKAMLNDREISIRDETLDNESLLLTYGRFHHDFTTHFSGKVRSLGSTAAHLCYVARGTACGSVLGNIHLWDIAAGLVILEAAGGEIRNLKGHAFEAGDYLEGQNIDQVLLAAAPGNHSEIGKTLQAK